MTCLSVCLSGVVPDGDVSVSLSVCLSGVVPDGDVSTVRQSEAVLPQQLADVPHSVSSEAERPRLDDGKSCSRVTLQTTLV